MRVSTVQHLGYVCDYPVFPSRAPMNEYYYVIVLELEGRRVYVGSTRNLAARLNSLFNQDYYYAPKFVQAYRPIQIVQLYHVWGYNAAEQLKNDLTACYARFLGAANVRGGRFVALDPADDWIQRQQSRSNSSTMSQWIRTRVDRLAVNRRYRR